LAHAGWYVAGIGHGDWGVEEPGAFGVVDWKRVDIVPESLQSFDRIQLIVHCAGGASVAASLIDPDADFRRTVTTTSSVLDFARRHSPPVPVVYPSSVAVHGVTPLEMVREDAPLQPVSPYGLHKKIAEDLCCFHAQNWHVPVAIVRLFSVYGPGLRKQLLWDACNKIAGGEFVFFGTGDETRDWLHVNDAAALLVAAARHVALDAPVVNGGTGTGTSTRDVIRALCRLLGQTAEPQFSGIPRPGDPPRYVADTARSRAWGWESQQSLEDGLSDYVRWFRTL
jgi:UDP-glucose 4-epimerase